MTLETAEVHLGIHFTDQTLLERALTHRSFLNETTDYLLEDNVRLEFLGDAILDFVTTEYLYHRFPDMQEGQLTSLRSALVRTETLAQFAQAIGLGHYLQMGKGEEDSGGRVRSPILCGAFEALMGSLYLDQGLEPVKNFFLALIKPEIEKILISKSDKDCKSLFQELAQGFRNITPVYKDLEEAGPDHAKQFTVGAYLDRVCYGQGTGPSKQQAAQSAARAALRSLKSELNAD